MSETTERNLVSLAKGGSIAGMLAVGLWVVWGALTSAQDRYNEQQMLYIQELKKAQDILRVEIKECSDGNTQLLTNQLERNTIVLEKIERKI